MPNRLKPKASVADLVVVIGFAALGLAALRLTFSTFSAYWFTNRRWDDRGLAQSARAAHEMAVVHGVAPLVMASLAVVVLTLRATRPPRRWAEQRPGALLCLVAVVVGLGTALVVRLTNTDPVPSPTFLADEIAYPMVAHAGWALVGAWLTLPGRKRPAPLWLDRIGYVVAWLWFLLHAGPVLALTAAWTISVVIVFLAEH